MSKFIFSLFAVIALSSFTTQTKPQAGPTPFREIFTDNYTFTFFNNCSGEEVEITGTETHEIFGVINDGKIRYNSKVTVNQRGLGLTSGKLYTGHAEDLFSEHISTNGALYVTNTLSKGILATAGGDNNIKFSYSFHVTVDANGNVTVLKGESEFGCQ